MNQGPGLTRIVLCAVAWPLASGKHLISNGIEARVELAEPYALCNKEHHRTDDPGRTTTGESLRANITIV